MYNKIIGIGGTVGAITTLPKTADMVYQNVSAVIGVIVIAMIVLTIASMAKYRIAIEPIICPDGKYRLRLTKNGNAVFHKGA